MMFYSFYFILLTLSIIVSGGLALYQWRYRYVSGATTLLLLTVSIIAWRLAQTLEIFSPTLDEKIFWMRVRMTILMLQPLPLLATALALFSQTRWVKHWHWFGLAIVPSLSILLNWTSAYHTWFRYDFRLDTTGLLPLLAWTNGACFWVHFVWVYSVIGLCLLLLTDALRHAPPARRRVMVPVVASFFVPASIDVLFAFGFSPVPGINFTSFAIILVEIALTLALRHYRMLDVVPIARALLIEDMPDGVLVLDRRNRIVDINSAAQQLLNQQHAPVIGQPIETALAAYPDWPQGLRETHTGRLELTLDGAEPRYFDLHISPLHDGLSRSIGRLIVFRDITERKRDESALQAANQQLETQLAEIQILQQQLQEQAIRDPLTDLFNRRYMDETLEREFARALREAYPVSIVMMDLDHFKEFNDTFGHKAGDLLLQALGNLLRQQSRHADAACRYGGEEFVVIMPNATLEHAYLCAERWRLAFQALRLCYENHELRATLSLGIAVCPLHSTLGEEVLRLADKALYMAKHAGRNCTRVWETAS
jgi:diguanylate cyclase (GGDEF)-like protein/PAS domain S-box-containing protein